VTLQEIDTPALIVDLDALDRNIAKMARLAAAADVRLRPHAKTHKCPTIALKQIAQGAIGQCAQKVGEAEELVRGGVKDVLVSNQVVGSGKLRRLAALAAEATIAVCFDHPDQVDAASHAAREAGVEIGGLVEIDVGMERCGVQPGVPARDLARRIADASNLSFRGLQAYHGRAQHFQSIVERGQAIDEAIAAVKVTMEVLAADGLPCPVVTGAGTGTFQFEAASGVYTELQVGSYVFMDVDYARIDGEDGSRFGLFEHSLFVFSTVMSVPAAHRAIVDAGLKSYSGEKGLPWVHGKSGVEVVAISDEHGKLHLRPGAPHLRLGDKIALIPGHCDPTVNLHDWYVCVRNGRVEELWPITARGASC
jgi:D-serine deaminase-like pyridoxal phosphate-dependent protein